MATLKNPTVVSIPIESVELEASLAIPDEARGIVLFAHGSGSSRHSPRNNFVAHALQDAGLATLLMDLLTEEEDTNYQTRFDIELLSSRLLGFTRWVLEAPQCRGLRPGYFGASTGGAAALEAAAELGRTIGAVVSRGGRPDLAWEVLDKVEAPTLFIVGALDDVVVELNQRAYRQLKAEKQLALVPGATHLFEEPGTLEEAARLASDWFVRHLTPKQA